MRLLFLIPLTIGLMSSYVVQNSSQEIAYLAGTLAFITFTLSLILAPWQIQLLILLIVIVATKKLWLPGEKDNSPDEQIINEDNASALTTNGEEKTEIKYRGVSYESTPTAIEVVEDNVLGKYRGSSCKIHKSTAAISNTSNVELKYRGVTIKRQTIEPEP